jgi:nucleoside-diphosphate-sugar epimerase
MAVYLITGIAGFIGSSLAEALVARGERVRGVDNFLTGKRENLTPFLDKIDFREADLRGRGHHLSRGRAAISAAVGEGPGAES